MLKPGNEPTDSAEVQIYDMLKLLDAKDTASCMHFQRQAAEEQDQRATSFQF